MLTFEKCSCCGEILGLRVHREFLDLVGNMGRARLSLRRSPSPQHTGGDHFQKMDDIIQFLESIDEQGYAKAVDAIAQSVNQEAVLFHVITISPIAADRVIRALGKRQDYKFLVVQLLRRFMTDQGYDLEVIDKLIDVINVNGVDEKTTGVVKSAIPNVAPSTLQHVLSLLDISGVELLRMLQSSILAGYSDQAIIAILAQGGAWMLKEPLVVAPAGSPILESPKVRALKPVGRDYAAFWLAAGSNMAGAVTEMIKYDYDALSHDDYYALSIALATDADDVVRLFDRRDRDGIYEALEKPKSHFTDNERAKYYRLTGHRSV